MQDGLLLSKKRRSLWICMYIAQEGRDCVYGCRY